ncbi:rod shape-determining protein MreC, partial [Magnetococcales bacterium HHB-1]
MDLLRELLRQYRIHITALFLLSLTFTLLLSMRSSHHRMVPKVVHEFLLDMVGPVQYILLAPWNLLHQQLQRLDNLKYLEERNRQLTAQLQRTKPNQNYIEELRQENRRLRKLLNMPSRPTFRQLTTRIVGTSSSAFSHSFILDTGRKEGITEDTPIVVSEGLMGRVVRVSDQSALALSLLDLNSRVPVISQRSRAQAIAAGTNGPLLRLDFAAKDTDIKKNDIIVTSGMGGVFPKGLTVGRVVSIIPGEQGLFQRIMLRPAVNFNRIEEVKLLLPPHTLADTGINLRLPPQQKNHFNQTKQSKKIEEQAMKEARTEKNDLERLGKEYLRTLHLLAEQKNAKASHNLGSLYFSGQGVEKNYLQAAHWFQIAAKQGVAPSQHNLGVIYLKGLGIPPDSK